MRMFQFKTFANSPIPSTLAIRPGHVEDLFYLSDTNPEDRDWQIFQKESGSTKSGDLWVFRTTEEDYEPLLLFNELVGIPSVVINYKIFMGGVHTVNFRFHSSNLSDISDFLARAFAEFKNLDLVYLGKTAGITAIFSELNRIMPLYYLSVNIHVPDSDMELVSQANIKWTREQKYKSSDSAYYAVYYFNEPVNQPPGILTAIDESHGLYYRKSSSKIIKDYLTDFIAQSYPSFFEIQSLSEHHITIETVVLKTVVRQHLLTLKKVIAKLQGWNMEVNTAVPFEKI